MWVKSVFFLGLTAGAAWAEPVTYRFDWQGSGGFAMAGVMQFDAAHLGKRLVIETDIACFAIEGTQDGVPIGRWALGMLEIDTTWTLTFDTLTQEFVSFGPNHQMPQAWNMDGAGFNCGDPGFGFNIGNAAQDICVNGDLMVASQVRPSRPFPVTRDDGAVLPEDACVPELLLSVR